eukprot:CAMPEP_0117660102 /NCGR_PEP_ID=MMETSP0804-20121206/6787_1 /TAXON_ID=1074897 /ORGANISM="Tetraselmis astigmatica, Strain CCMP880" /LENGTH=650 /DNA_ID=CAMNT_0005466805 /DNA_START=520 /DNA_END=2472 /DNA_ORIENTATION=-
MPSSVATLLVFAARCAAVVLAFLLGSTLSATTVPTQDKLLDVKYTDLTRAYERLLDHATSPSMPWGGISVPPGCENGCELPNYLRIPGTPRSEVRNRLRILVVLESSCPISYNLDQETVCSDFGAHRTLGNCLGVGLPFAQFSSWESQREVKGYYKAAYTAMFRRLLPYMLSRGWKKFYVTQWSDEKFEKAARRKDRVPWQDVHAADIIITSIEIFRKLVKLYTKTRYILVSTNDAATISTGTGCDLVDGRILSLLQHTSLFPISENNELLISSRRHFHWISGNETMLTPHRRTPAILPPQALQKVETLIPQILRWRYPLDCGGNGEFTVLQQVFETNYWKYTEKYVQEHGAGHQGIPMLAEITARKQAVFLPIRHRKYDIAYMGVTVEGAVRGLYGVNQHRMRAVAAIKKLKEAHPHLSIFIGLAKMHYQEYIEVLRDSKIFVSPFGLGEFSGKDYEAILSGCLLVKPEAQRLQAYPNIYGSEYSISVRADFSDLEAVVMPYLTRPLKARVHVARALSLIQHHTDTLDTWADDLDKHIIKLATRSVAFDPRGCRRSSPWMYDRNGQPLAASELRKLAAERLEAGLPVSNNESAAEAEMQLAEQYGQAHNHDVLEQAKEMRMDVRLPPSRRNASHQHHHPVTSVNVEAQL